MIPINQVKENPSGAKQNQQKAELRVKAVFLCVPVCPYGDQNQPAQYEKEKENPARGIARIHLFALLVFNFMWVAALG